MAEQDAAPVPEHPGRTPFPEQFAGQVSEETPAEEYWHHMCEKARREREEAREELARLRQHVPRKLDGVPIKPGNYLREFPIDNKFRVQSITSENIQRRQFVGLGGMCIPFTAIKAWYEIPDPPGDGEMPGYHDVDDMLDELRATGLDAWDDVDLESGHYRVTTFVADTEQMKGRA